VAQAWAKSVNASGGIQGHPVEITLKDDASNPGTAVTDAQALISDQVDVILDLDVLDSTWEKAVDAAKIPVVGGNFSSQGYFTDPNFYPSGQTQDTVVVADVTTLKAAGATRVGQLYCAESPSCAEGVAPRKSAAQAIGLTDAYDGSISSTAPNYTAQCLAGKQANVGGFHIGGAAATIVRIAQDCGAQGYHPVIELNGTAYTAQLAATPDLKDSLWASFPVLPYFVDSPAVKAMDTAVDQYYPVLRSDPMKWSEYALQAWTAGLLIQDAVMGAGLGASNAVTPGAITTGLNSIKDDTLEGLAPPLTFTADKPHSVGCWYTARLQNGTPTLVDGGKLTCTNGSGS
jgi:branched-chain amino acid transport system substrate-binding protein